jgi:hypothetical protein
MATAMAPDGHQHGGCDYVDPVLEKWTNRQHLSTTFDRVDYDCQQLLSLSLSLALNLSRPEGKRPFVRLRRMWENNIRMDLREICWKMWTGLI